MNHLAYPNCRTPRLVLGMTSVILAGALGCTAGVKASTGGSGGNGASVGQGGSGTTGGSTGSGTGGVTVTGAGGGSGGSVNNGVDASYDGPACQTANIPFTPNNPTVYLLVSRSGSMYHCLNATSSESSGNPICINSTTNAVDMANTAWDTLKTAIEQVLPTLDSQVRFGFTTIYGTNPAGGGTCPSETGMLTDNVAPALNNAAVIATLYDSLPFPPNSTQVGQKFESPISWSLGNVTKALMADTTQGSKYILLITNGMPDYCDDSNVLCPPDSVIWKEQLAYAAGIKTIVFGIQSTLFSLAPGVLQAFANAGAGEPTVAPVNTGGSTFDFYDQCDGIAGWMSDLAAKGTTPMRGDTLGTYSATMGPTMPFAPSASDVTMLETQLSSALAGVRSCVFDTSALKLSIDTSKLSQAQVDLVDNAGNKTVLQLDSSKTNGWYMDNITTNSMGVMTSTTLELFGPACSQLRSPNTVNIEFNFPCDLQVVIN